MIKNLKGTFDYMPKDMKVRNDIIGILRSNFEKYGYLPVETAMLNYYDLLSYKYEDDAEILSEIYKLTDQGDRKLGLRYDLTVPFCKIVATNKDIVMPFRRYEIGKVFRNGPVKTGRTREFYQCDIDVVGIDNRFIEAEQMCMAINTYKELGIDVICKYNNRKLMSGLIEYAGISDDKVDSVIGIIDKMEKVSSQELEEMMLDKGIEKEKIDKLFNLFEMELDEYRELANENEKIYAGVTELTEINEYLNSLGIDGNCVFSPTLARGLSIYTGIVFEFFDREERLSCALGGGGRYDKIITNFMDNGNSYPAVGLSFGLEPIFNIKKMEYDDKSLIDIYMVPLDTNVDTLKLATVLRENGYRILIEMNKKKIAKCFEYADRENIPYVMIIGLNEVENNCFKIKDMKRKEEYSFSREELIKYLNNNK
ncbi:MAG: histidine--tRNA ligase [Erysipelotrichaceae bacterium]|nr:histidine--tRNA ligase [Erysipelotrichaceae bacterium]MDY3934759.1 histidine--tRNA ligase [Bacilli bacterium]